jgi:putative peptidoglycan lipid II flippase
MSKQNGESLGRSSGKISAATATSRVTGLVRETVFAYLLGSGTVADAYFAATRIPNLLRDLFAEGALGAAFVPVVSEKLAGGDRQGAFALVNRMATGLSLVVGVIVLLGIAAAPWLVRGLAPGFDAVPGKTELTVLLVRWTFPYLWLISLAALVAGTLNALRRFGVPASAPIFFNLGHIATALIFWRVFDPPVVALAAGVVVGAAGQLLFQLPALRAAGFRIRLALPWGDPDVRRVVGLMIPVVLGLGALQLNNLTTTIIASFLPEGSLSYLNYAFRLMHFPLGVFAVAIGTAVLPRASAAVAHNDRPGLQAIYDEGLALATFLVIPAAIFLILFPDVIVAVIYQRGAFGAADTVNVSAALRFYALGLLGYTGVRVSAPVFYAHRDTRTPMRYAMTSVALNIGLNVALAVPMGFVGLALANALAGTTNFLLLHRRLRSRYDVGPGRAVRRDVSILVLDGIVAGTLTWIAWSIWSIDPATAGWVERITGLGGLGAVFLALYLWRTVRAESPQRRLLRKLLKR